MIVDGFCGINAINFAFSCERFLDIDIDLAKIELARNRARVYGIADRLPFSPCIFRKCSEIMLHKYNELSGVW